MSTKILRPSTLSGVKHTRYGKGIYFTEISPVDATILTHSDFIERIFNRVSKSSIDKVQYAVAVRQNPAWPLWNCTYMKGLDPDWMYNEDVLILDTRNDIDISEYVVESSSGLTEIGRMIQSSLPPAASGGGGGGGGGGDVDHDNAIRQCAEYLRTEDNLAARARYSAELRKSIEEAEAFAKREAELYPPKPPKSPETEARERKEFLQRSDKYVADVQRDRHRDRHGHGHGHGHGTSSDSRSRHRHS